MIETWGPDLDDESAPNPLDQHFIETAPAETATAEDAATQPVWLDDTILTALLDMADEDDPDFFRHLVGTFINDSAKLMESLQTEAASGNAPQLAQVAHSLKGSSNNVGALGLAALCEHIQQQAEQAQLADLAPHLQQVAIELDRVCIALKQAADKHHI